MLGNGSSAREVSVYFNIEKIKEAITTLTKVCGLLSVKNCHVKVSKLTLRIHITVAVMTDELIVGREKFPQYARCFYDKKSQFYVELLHETTA